MQADTRRRVPECPRSFSLSRAGVPSLHLPCAPQAPEPDYRSRLVGQWSWTKAKALSSRAPSHHAFRRQSKVSSREHLCCRMGSRGCFRDSYPCATTTRYSHVSEGTWAWALHSSYTCRSCSASTRWICRTWLRSAPAAAPSKCFKLLGWLRSRARPPPSPSCANWTLIWRATVSPSSPSAKSRRTVDRQVGSPWGLAQKLSESDPSSSTVLNLRQRAKHRLGWQACRPNDVSHYLFLFAGSPGAHRS